ncbi:pilus assembly protein PilO [Massilia arenosa]|uniref:Pilus assembly protein PilO n=1 Tax=Zemynaea arenosa TaxID=2561931 RepID=A0A4Y9SJE4_9BURK|nr:type 4a pilus biogenesis protein PilO [Massilia arenosa]TFW21063.1 pilus assembly protein PilO [Massilia arenosa]
MKIDIKQFAQSLADQFRGLNGRHPGMWPLAPRIMCALGVTVAVVALGYFGYWSSQFEDQERLAAEETKLRDEYKLKIAQAINLEELQKQRLQVDAYVEGLEKQLPSKADMDALLSDINQAGVGRGLQFELFKPGQVVLREYYAELPIDIRVSGSYHDIGSFAGDMANLSRIVTLNNMTLTTRQDGTLTLDAIAKTFRYLDPDEAAAQREAALKDKKNKKAKKGGAK